MVKQNEQKFCLLDIENADWATYVDTHSAANAFHHPAWVRLISECYGYQAFICAVIEDGVIQAGIPMINFESPLTGKRWISIPYTDFCQPLSNNTIALEHLVDGLLDIHQDRGIPTIEFRWNLPAKSGINSRSDFVLHELTLSPDLSTTYEKFRRDHRYNLRKADPNQVQINEVTNKREFDEFYRLHVQTRRRLGVPVQPKKFFDLLWANLIQAGIGFALIAYHDHEPISGAVFLNFKDSVIYKYSASDEAYWKLIPNKLLLWQAIQLASEKGYKILNFGNSPSMNKGLREFKAGWGARETELTYSYIGAMPQKYNSGVSNLIMSYVIRHSPSFICRITGELLYKHFN